MFSYAIRRGIIGKSRTFGFFRGGTNALQVKLEPISNSTHVRVNFATIEHKLSLFRNFETGVRGLSQLSTPGISKRPFSSSRAAGGVDNLNDPNTYTENTFGVISKMPQYAEMYSLQYMEAPLLLYSSLNEGKQSLAYRIFKTAGVDPEMVIQKADEYLKVQPRVQTNNRVMGQSTIDALREASKLQSEYGDQFISIEHILFAVSGERASVGALQGSIEGRTQMIDVAIDNYDSTRSRVQDVDVAEESTRLAKYNILVQSSTAILAQATQLPQNILRLLN